MYIYLLHFILVIIYYMRSSPIGVGQTSGFTLFSILMILCHICNFLVQRGEIQIVVQTNKMNYLLYYFIVSLNIQRCVHLKPATRNSVSQASCYAVSLLRLLPIVPFVPRFVH